MAIHIVSINTLADLKNTPGTTENIVITLGQASKGDSLGALYYFDPDDTTTAEDAAYNTVIPLVGTGRWKKVFTRRIALPHGNLIMNAGKKEFFATGITNASGEVTFNLTMDGTAGGVAIFQEIWFNDSKAIVNAATANDVVTSGVKSTSADRKQTTHKFIRGKSNLLNLSIVTTGLTIAAFDNAVTSTPVNIKVEGI